MGKPAYIFAVTPYDMSLLPQVRSALEKRTELASREKLPGMWKTTDRLAAGSAGRAADRANRKRSRQKAAGAPAANRRRLLFLLVQ